MKYLFAALFLFCTLSGNAQRQKAASRTQQPDTAWSSQHTNQPAQFPGDWRKYVEAHLEYPPNPDEIQGRVWVQFIVKKDGSIANEKVMRSLSPAFDAKALKLVHNMPKWLPGTVNGVEVDSYYNVVIVFALP